MKFKREWFGSRAMFGRYLAICCCALAGMAAARLALFGTTSFGKSDLVLVATSIAATYFGGSFRK